MPPCFVSLYFNTVMFALIALPYLLRGLRVVILADKGEWSITVSSPGVSVCLCHKIVLYSPCVVAQTSPRVPKRKGPSSSTRQYLR